MDAMFPLLEGNYNGCFPSPTGYKVYPQTSVSVYAGSQCNCQDTHHKPQNLQMWRRSMEGASQEQWKGWSCTAKIDSPMEGLMGDKLSTWHLTKPSSFFFNS